MPTVNERLYEEAKAKLNDFLENTPKFKSPLKALGRKLLQDLISSEAAQEHKSLIFMSATATINEFIAQVEAKLKSRLELYKNELIILLENQKIDDSFKEEGQKLLGQYSNAITDNIPINELILLTSKIKAENKKIINKDMNQRYLIAKLALTDLINDTLVPIELKDRAPDLLKDEAIDEELIQLIQEEIAYINRKIGKIESECNDKKMALDAILNNVKIDLSIKVHGIELIAAYQTIKAERKSVIALIEHTNLFAQEINLIITNDKKLNLQRLVNDQKIPEEFKARARELLKKELFTEEFRQELEAEAFSINNKVQEILSEYLDKKALLNTTLATAGIPEEIKVDARRLLTRIISSYSNNLSFDVLREQANELKEGNTALQLKIDEWRLALRYKRASVILWMNIQAPCIPEKLKTAAIKLSKNTHITLKLITALETTNLSIDAEIERIRNNCLAKKDKLIATLADTQINEESKDVGRKLLALYQNKEARKEPWDSLDSQAQGLLLENNIIPKRIAFQPLRNNLKMMEEYGYSLPLYSRKRGEIITLARELQLKISGFIESSKTNLPTEGKFKLFKDEFTQLLHSKDDEMGKHRMILKPIFANILIALSGIGLVAIVLNASFRIGSALINNKKISLNNSFFFAKTNSDQKIDEVEEQLRNTN